MKKILYIAPASFPVNGAEAIVNVKLLQTLLNSGGFDVDVVSKKYKNANYPSTSLDDYGIDNSKIHIVEVDNRINIKTIWATTKCFFKFGATMKGAHWAYVALPTIEKLIKTNKYDYTLTKNSPSFLLGHYLKKKYGIKWVASWNDPFPMEKYPSPYGLGWDYNDFFVRLQVKVMRNADVHIFPNIRLRDYMQHYINFKKEDAIVIPHVSNEKPIVEYQSTDTLRIIHTGHLGRPRNARIFLDGLKKTIAQTPDIRISFSILGILSNEDKKAVENSDLKPYVNYLEPVDYKKSLEVASTYDVAVIIEADCDEGIFLPTKVGDYMCLHLPIFAISPKNGVLNDLRKEGYIQYFADVKNSDEVCEQLLLIYKDFLNGRLHRSSMIKPDYLPESVVEKYEGI